MSTKAENDLVGYLTENRIESAECDMNHSFAFISYAHTVHDMDIVRYVFEELTRRGYNLWLDAANIPHDRNSWKNAAFTALETSVKNCRLLLYFRSEESITRRTIADELETYKRTTGGKGEIVTVEIYENERIHTKTLLQDMNITTEGKEGSELTRAQEKIDSYNKICDIINSSCSAIQYNDRKGVNKDRERLVDEIEKELNRHGIHQQFSLADRILSIMDGSFRIRLQGEQLFAFHIFRSMVEKSYGTKEKKGDGKKRILIVEGDPGTGKSVLLMYMLTWLMRQYGLAGEKREGIQARWVSKNNAPREVYRAKLEADLAAEPERDPDKISAEELLDIFDNTFKGPSAVTNEQKNMCMAAGECRALAECQKSRKKKKDKNEEKAEEEYIEGMDIEEEDDKKEESSKCADRVCDKKQICDVLFIDEAHRLTNFDRYNPDVRIAQCMMYAGLCTVIMSDDNQIVSTADVGKREQIYEWAEETGAEIFGAHLRNQLRCAGADSYMQWLTGILGMNTSGKYVTKMTDYDLKVFDDPNEMFEAIRQKDEESARRNEDAKLAAARKTAASAAGKRGRKKAVESCPTGISRVLAGYCWNWKNEKNKKGVKDRVNPDVCDIEFEYQAPSPDAPGETVTKTFRKSWNLMTSKPYGADAGSIDQVGCVHTTQGIEFRYVGVIIGNDLEYVTEEEYLARTQKSIKDKKKTEMLENARKKFGEEECAKRKIRTDFSMRAGTDASVNGLKTHWKDDPEGVDEVADTIIKNTYRVLLSRGVEGCYIYCVDKNLQEYMKKMVDRYNASIQFTLGSKEDAE